MSDRDNVEFGKLAVALGFITKPELEKCIRLQQDLERVGVLKRLGEILLEKKILAREQVLLILRAQGKRVLSCPRCRKSYNVHAYRPEEAYFCKHCRGNLSIPLKATDPLVSDSIRINTTDLRAMPAEIYGRAPAQVIQRNPRSRRRNRRMRLRWSHCGARPSESVLGRPRWSNERTHPARADGARRRRETDHRPRYRP